MLLRRVQTQAVSFVVVKTGVALLSAGIGRLAGKLAFPVSLPPAESVRLFPTPRGCLLVLEAPKRRLFSARGIRSSLLANISDRSQQSAKWR